jgi:hypothetical protein
VLPADFFAYGDRLLELSEDLSGQAVDTESLQAVLNMEVDLEEVDDNEDNDENDEDSDLTAQPLDCLLHSDPDEFVKFFSTINVSRIVEATGSFAPAVSEGGSRNGPTKFTGSVGKAHVTTVLLASLSCSSIWPDAPV